MGLVDNLKTKVSEFAQHHEGKVDRGLEKAAKMIDEKTKGKYSDKIHTGTDKAKGAMDRIAHMDSDQPGGGTPPGSQQPPTAP
ncbi:antitoxin [Streptomyces sp. NPDC048664]|uniref:antitoxin n=1 Tax=Streptomyces sp. NPDC048664 TaxID=3154505 RepID=UPI00341E2395